MHLSSFVLCLSTLVAAALVAAQSLVVNTNATITVCVANRFTWSGGQAPYSVFLIKPLHPEMQLAALGSTSDNYIVYTPDGKTKGVQVGDTVAVYVTDGQGNTNGSAATTINGTGSSACTASSSGGSGSGNPSDEATTTSTSGTTSRPSGSNPAAASASENTKTGSATPGVKVSGGLLAGLVGLFAAALL